MSWIHRLLNRREYGRIYSTHAVPSHLSDAAERAISENRYRVHGKRDHQSVLVLQTSPPLVAVIERQPSPTGGAPDMIIGAVYEPDGDPEQLADDLSDH